MEQEVMRPRIGAQEVLRAAEILRKYRRGKENLDKRIIDNEQFWKLRHWEQMEKAGEGGNPADPRPASGWLVNCILSKHADAMDSYPEPTVLPREPDDREEAAKLTRILPVILKNNRFKREYAKAWWNKLKSGCAVYGVFWDGDKLHGLGDVDIRSMDVLNLFWEPGVQDIQASEHFFSTELVPDHRLLREYPQLEGKLGRGGGAQVSRYLYDDRVDTSDRSLVVDWYYHTEVNGQPVLQYCKFVGETVLYATENDPAYAERSWYDHGKYPFVFDVLFPEEGTPCGYVLIGGKRVKVVSNTTGKLVLEQAVTATDKAVIYPGEGGKDGCAVYGCLFLGKGAYGVVDLSEGTEVIVKPRGSSGTADPLDQRSSVGWKGVHAAAILYDEYMVRVECGSSYSGEDKAN
jgi:hypothetical protein